MPPLALHPPPAAELLLVTILAAESKSFAEEASHIRARFPSAKLVGLVDAVISEQVLQIWPSVDGLVLRTIGSMALVKALELVLLGERVIPGISLETLFENAHNLWQPVASSPPGWAHLSPREVEVLRSLSAGHSNKIIARQIGISEATVKVHMKGILRKLRATNRTEAAVWARNHGLVSLRSVPEDIPPTETKSFHPSNAVVPIRRTV
ncbi:response regulator transcription factor [Siccirubricoccus sp. G192]|uniref:LuxR C-terminal-related transcriptional regulator n=1 Tax=Siccirubricoccus sp. G192 TaxID=2849651 RepID=UPI001C2C4CE7|nr:response regulator transcription factor [Siccirubricoccus sp. G192]MBV1795648.1 response regulator transcription factor [Siccirubricoccus sp. G192]